MKKFIKIFKISLSILLIFIGFYLVIYDIYWLLTKGNNYSGGILSGLGKGFAVLNIVFGVIFLLIGIFLFNFFKRKNKNIFIRFFMRFYHSKEFK